MRTAEDIVRDRYPNAISRKHEAVHQLGQKAPIEVEHWAIYPADGLGYQPIGVGDTELEAWVAASTKVLGQLRQPVGLRIKILDLKDAIKAGCGPLLDAVNATLDKGEDVIVEELDGSESLLERDGDQYRTKPRE